MNTLLIIVVGIIMYGFGFFSGSICMAEDNAKIHNQEHIKASIHFNQINQKNNDKTI
tara:strand:+ start:2179 stop:2349 length:171 start_codon:yes stop_codon:yes gene_type:complete